MVSLWAKLHSFKRRSFKGFTIVELLIVIVVIGVLASITVVAYNGIQQRGRETKIKADFSQIAKAIALVHADDKTLLEVTGDGWTAGPCFTKPDGTDLASLDRSDDCWVDYLDTLDKLSSASGMDLRHLVDPWGRPYLIDENEGEGGPTDCSPDIIAIFRVPFVSNDAEEWTPIPTLCTS